MTALKINVFGGMIPVQDDTLLPDGAATVAQNTWLQSGSLTGLKPLRLLRALSNPLAKRVFRIPNDFAAKTDYTNSFYMEFPDADVDVLRAPTLQDSYQRYYWMGALTAPAYNTLARIRSQAGNYTLGIPAPVSAPTVYAPNEAADTTAPVATTASANGALIVISFTEDRALDSSVPPPKTAFQVTSGGAIVPVSSVGIDEASNKVLLYLTKPVGHDETVVITYTDPSIADDSAAIQDLAGNDAAGFTITALNETADTLGPRFVSATVTGNQVTLKFDDTSNLRETNTPDGSTFDFYADDAKIGVETVSVFGASKTVVLGLQAAVIGDQTCYITYRDATASDDVDAIQDVFGNDAPSFTRRPVANLTADSKPPTITGAVIVSQLLTMSFNEILDNTVAIPTSRFAVSINGVGVTVTDVSIDSDAKNVNLLLGTPAYNNDYIRVSYTYPGSGTDVVRDRWGNAAASISSYAVTNHTSVSAG